MKELEPQRRRAPTAGPSLAREVAGVVFDSLRNALSARAALAKAGPSAVDVASEPPVVAQLMIEIRSDGSRTIARGAMNDLRSGESAQVHAEGRSPGELAVSLAASLLALPSTLFQAATGASLGRSPTRESPDPDKERG